MRVGVVAVHYRTPELMERCAEALRRAEAELGGATLEIVVVDNSAHEGVAGGDGEVGGLATLEGSHGVRLVEPPANLGYAGGFNRGVGELPRADVLVAANPDVLVESRCLAELVRALGADGVGVAGPRFYWDRPGGHLLPPAEERSRRRELQRYRAHRRGGAAARRARAAWRRHARRHWLAEDDLPSHALSGAFLAIARDAWQRVGPFDDGYRLYFEETDWLERARRAGVGGVHVPAARALHAYARSTPEQPRAGEWFAESEARFRRRWYGAGYAEFLERLATRWPPRPEAVSDGAPDREPGSGAAWIEISASPLGFPASARRAGEGEAPLLDEYVRRRATETPLFWRTVDADGRESASRPVPPSPPPTGHSAPTGPSDSSYTT